MKLRVASYNIQHGALVNMDMRTIAADIDELALDIVGLQEVDINTERSGCIDTMRLLSEASGLKHHAFARGIALGSGEYGTGILSRFPILSFEVIPLESGEAEQRSVGHALLELGGRRLHFFNTHLSFERRELRTAQLAELARLLPSDEPFILTGDFNTADFSELEVLPHSLLLNCEERLMGSFYPSDIAIDNIVLSKGWRLLDYGMPRVAHSDHYMIWCEVETLTAATIFTGGQVFAATAEELELPQSSLVIAADSGYQTALRLGVEPDLLLGDLDSLDTSGLDRQALDRLEKHIVSPIKDDTDTQLAVDTALERGADYLHIVGGLGGRLDHTLSTVFLLEYIHDRGAYCLLTDGHNRVRLLKSDGDAVKLRVERGYRYLSLVSLTDVCEGVSICGVYYPLDGVELKRSYSYAVSNEITAQYAEITLERGVMLVIESEDASPRV